MSLPLFVGAVMSLSSPEPHFCDSLGSLAQRILDARHQGTPYVEVVDLLDPQFRPIVDLAYLVMPGNYPSDQFGQQVKDACFEKLD